MVLNKNLVDKFVKVTSEAAVACGKYVGKNDKIIADKAATETMRKNLNNLDIDGKVVIGEGELDKAPMLYIGEKLGLGTGPSLDIAVDPLEGTNFVAKNLPGALSVIAISSKNNLFHAPETYMNKLAVGSDVPKDAIDLDFSVEKNIKNIADAKNKDLSKMTACILDRPRHKEIIKILNDLNVNIKLITDGDVSGALLVTNNKYNIDLFLGIGGGPEGVLAACALDAYNCHFQGRFIFHSDNDKKRAKEMGIVDFTKKYDLKEIVKGDSIFCATGITDGDLVKGISINGDTIATETFVTHKNTNFKKIIKTEFNT